jgi:hypothetical protein
MDQKRAPAAQTRPKVAAPVIEVFRPWASCNRRFADVSAAHWRHGADGVEDGKTENDSTDQSVLWLSRTDRLSLWLRSCENRTNNR